MLDFNGDEYQRGFDEAEYILTPEELAKYNSKKEFRNSQTAEESEENDKPGCE